MSAQRGGPLAGDVVTEEVNGLRPKPALVRVDDQAVVSQKGEKLLEVLHLATKMSLR